MCEFTTKQHHFISLVQIILGIQLLRRVEPGSELSFVTTDELNTMEQIYVAAKQISENMTAAEAAKLYVASTREK